ncbi:MAG TPA: P1 family peptidase [Gaiellaceae bacterium]|nr:P1 family peptidase [Gaiellaceae bacterium]
MAASAPDPRGPRPRELGVVIGELEPGPTSSIADVEGVRVGHVTVWKDEPVARTGVTAIVPPSLPVPAGVAVLNGAGELTSSHEIREWGEIETPIYLTSTHAVGRVYDGAVQVAVRDDPLVGVERFVIPVVGECDDGWLSDARTVHVTAADVAQAVDGASEWPFAEGAVGAGTGMSCLGWKGGIGSASRVAGDHVVGVLVLANYGSARQLTIAGVPVGRHLPSQGRASDAGSCIAVVATDAPLSPASLERIARRAGLGLARTGSVAHHGSGEIFVAFSTTSTDDVGGSDLNALFAATVEASEEAVVNALWAAPDVTGREGRVERGLPHDEVLELLREHGALA